MKIIAGLQNLWRSRHLPRAPDDMRKAPETMKHPAPPPAARELEVVVRRLWTREPRCSPAERTCLLTELGSIGLTLERIILRDETHSTRTWIDDDVRVADLAECERRIRNLLDRWPEDREARSSQLVTA